MAGGHRPAAASERDLITRLSGLGHADARATNATEHPDAAKSIDLEQASEALKELLGGNAKYVWAVGLLAAGQSSTMTGTYAG